MEPRSFTKEELADAVEKRDQNKADLNFWIQNQGGVVEIVRGLGSNQNEGLKKNVVPSKIEEFGKNVFPKSPPKSFLHLFYEAIQDKTLIILLISAVLSILLGVFVEKESHGWIEGTAIIIAVLAVSLVTAGNDYSKDQQFRKLSQVNENVFVKVVRDGQDQQISIYDVVVGDIVKIEAGDKICADGILLDGNKIKVDESPMTGEADSKPKGDKDLWMICGCEVTEGSGKMIVIAVGPNTQWGKIKSTVDREKGETPLQVKLGELADAIAKMGAVAAAFTFLTLLVQWFARKQMDEEFGISDLSEIIQYVITAITIIVVAVPEGLPLAVTISLAYSMTQMMKDQNLVRHLQACETMGGATTICSDKTGTLTENKMTVTQMWIGGQSFETSSLSQVNISKDQSELLAQSIAINSSAFIDRQETGSGKHVGSKTESALLDLLDKLPGQFDYSNLRKNYPKTTVFPFSSESKMMSTIVKIDGINYCFVKGASEVVLEKCQTMSDPQGIQHRLDKGTATIAIQDMARQALRTIGIAYAKLPGDVSLHSVPKEPLTLLAICGIQDPVREGVPEAVAVCQRAGITVRMLTGDNILTAKAIASQCGIHTDGGKAIEGPVFRQMSSEEIDTILPDLQVIARCSPQDKLILVQHLQNKGEVVAVTGDGTNDAPQLNQADVGFAMGIAGTDVAKGASDIVLLDDNFNSIVKAVLWGRNVNDSIRKFVQFQLTVNIVAVVIAFIGAVANGESPLKPVQMLWVNLIMDTLAALALATERPTRDMLKRRPYGRFEGIITPAMWRNILGQAVFQIGVLFVLMYRAHRIEQFSLPSDLHLWNDKDRLVHHTLIFNTFVFCQLFNEFNARKLGNEFNVLKGVFTNAFFVGIMGFTVAAQYFIVQYGGEYTSTVPLTKQQWIACVAIGSFSIPWGAFLRLIPASTVSPPTLEVVPIAKDNKSFRTMGMKVVHANTFVNRLRRRNTGTPSVVY